MLIIVKACHVSMSNDNKYERYIRTTAEIFAIIASAIGFYHFIAVDKDLQSQIGDLKILAQESIKQTKEIQKQNDLLREHNEILSQNIEKQNLTRVQDIKPSFTLDEYQFYGFQGLSPNLVNTGRTATIIDCIPYKDNIFNLNVPKVSVGTGARIGVSFYAENISENQTKPILHFKLIYKDLDNNKYCQIFSTKSVGEQNKIEVSSPVSIK